jgi:predicted cobalt transporter CbtA
MLHGSVASFFSQFKRAFTSLQVDVCAAKLAFYSQKDAWASVPAQEAHNSRQEQHPPQEGQSVHHTKEEHAAMDPVSVAVLLLRAAHELKATQVQLDAGIFKGLLCHAQSLAATNRVTSRKLVDSREFLYVLFNKLDAPK